MNVSNIRQNFSCPVNYQKNINSKVISYSDEKSKDAFVSNNINRLDIRSQLQKIVGNNSSPIITRQYSDNKGRITHMALNLGGDLCRRDQKRELLDVYKTLFTKLEPDTKFTVCCQYDSDKEDVERIIRDNNVENPERIKFYKPDTRYLTVWARDMTVSTFSQDNPDENFMLKSKHTHSYDGDIPAFINQQDSSLGIIDAPQLVVDGGDTVSNSKESFIGNNCIERTADQLEIMSGKYPEFNNWAMNYYKNEMGEDGNNNYTKTSNNPQGEDNKAVYNKLALNLFEEYFGKPVIPLGEDDPGTQAKEDIAAFHQDMCLTPVDDETFFMGDPECFKGILNSASPEDIKKADEQLSEISGRNVNITRLAEDFQNKNVKENFENYEKTLKDKGYNIIKLPYLMSNNEHIPSFTYNNCLIENFQKDGKEIKRVFLPVLGVDLFDNYAIKTYEDKGFEVYPIPMAESSKKQGELRCVTNCLERSEKV